MQLGGLQWENEVKPLMYQHLEPLKNLDVEIYEYDPNAKDSLYEKLYQSIHRLEVPDYQKHIGLTKNSLSMFMKVSIPIQSNRCWIYKKSMVLEKRL